MQPPRAPDTVWQHDMYSDSVAPSAPRASAIQTGTKVYISNLDYGVSNDDIKVNPWFFLMLFLS